MFAETHILLLQFLAINVGFFICLFYTLRPKLKNIDRSTAQQLAITVGNVTVIITDFKEKTRSSSTSSSTITSSAGSEQQHQSSGSESMDKGSSRASTPKGDLSVGHDESFWGPVPLPPYPYPAPLLLYPTFLDTMDPTGGEISPLPLLPCLIPWPTLDVERSWLAERNSAVHLLEIQTPCWVNFPHSYTRGTGAASWATRNNAPFPNLPCGSIQTLVCIVLYSYVDVRPSWHFCLFL